MRLVLVIALLSGCTVTEGLCKSDGGPDRVVTSDGAVRICTLVGTWTSSSGSIAFTADGTYTSTIGGANDTGTWSVAGVLGCGAVVTLGDTACGTIKGTYGLSVDPMCRTLSLSGQGDDCGVRANELSDTQFKKQ